MKILISLDCSQASTFLSLPYILSLPHERIVRLFGESSSVRGLFELFPELGLDQEFGQFDLDLEVVCSENKGYLQLLPDSSRRRIVSADHSSWNHLCEDLGGDQPNYSPLSFLNTETHKEGMVLCTKDGDFCKIPKLGEDLKKILPQIKTSFGIVSPRPVAVPWLRISETTKCSIRDLRGSIGELKDAVDLLSTTSLLLGTEPSLCYLASLMGVPTLPLWEGELPKGDSVVSPEGISLQDFFYHYIHGRFTQGVPSLFRETSLPSISIIITTKDEGSEVRATCEDLLRNAGCPLEIVLVADGTRDGSCDNLPDEVKVIRNEESLGVAPSRQIGFEQSSGDVVFFFDAHMRTVPGSIPRMARLATLYDSLICSPVFPLYSLSNEGFGGVLEIGEDNFLRSAWLPGKPIGPISPIECFVAPGWCISRENLQRLRGWIPGLSIWGSTEVCISMKCLYSGTPILLDTCSGCYHLFRGKTPFSTPTTRLIANNQIVIKTVTSDEYYEKFWRTLVPENLQKEIDSIINSITGFDEHRRAFHEQKRVRDEEVLRRLAVLNTSWSFFLDPPEDAPRRSRPGGLPFVFLKTFPNSRELYPMLFARHLSSYHSSGRHSDVVDLCLSIAKLSRSPVYDFLYIGEQNIEAEEIKKQLETTRLGAVVVVESTANLRDKLHRIGCDKFECYMEMDELVYFLNQPSD